MSRITNLLYYSVYLPLMNLLAKYLHLHQLLNNPLYYQTKYYEIML